MLVLIGLREVKLRGLREKKNKGIMVEKISRELDGEVAELSFSRKLALEKVKVAAIRCELEREKERVFTVGEVECGGKVEGLRKEEVPKVVTLPVKVDLKPTPSEEGGMASVCGNINSEVFREYLPFHDDVLWANRCILAKIKDGTSFTVIQQSFLDAGFSDFKLISLGGDNVLLHPCVEGDCMNLFNSASDLIGNFLCDCRPWSKDACVPYERGAWVRCYGVPLHAWNDIFFLELASSRGRLLKIEDATVNKDRLDFARFLIATPELKELNFVVNFLIEGREYPIRVIEDLEFGFAVDACLAEYEDDIRSRCSGPVGLQEEEPLVDAIVQHMHDDWVRKSNEVKGVISDLDISQSIYAKEKCPEVEKILCSPNTSLIKADKVIENVGDRISKFSKKSRVTKRPKVVPTLVGLKKIARLAEADRCALIRSLKKSKCSKRNLRKSTSSRTSSNTFSCNKNGVSLSAGKGPSGDSKDWKNWVALHGDAKGVEDDVVEVGNLIGVRCKNSFQALSRGSVRGGFVDGGEGRVLEARNGTDA